MRTEDIDTEVFFLPAAAHTEKAAASPTPSGCCSGTTRRSSRPGTPAATCGSSTTWAAGSGPSWPGARPTPTGADEMDRPILDLTWDYPAEGEQDEPDADAVLAEINGWDADGQPLSTFNQLKTDGSTACGCWIYCGVRAGGVNQAARRKPGREQNWVAPEWGWAWPANRRMLYNRASADPDGKPWSERKASSGGTRSRASGPGTTCRTSSPTGRRPTGRRPAPPGWPRSPATTRSSCRPTARRGCSPRPAWSTGRCPRTTSRRSRRCPTRSTAAAQPGPGDHHAPARTGSSPAAAEPGSDVFPYVFTTYRLTEHHTAGGMSAVPALPGRAAARVVLRGVAGAGRRARPGAHWAGPRSSRARNAIEARVLVTRRMKPLRAGGRPVHQIGLPWHWGPNGLTTGDAANELSHLALDPNVHIQEVKAWPCDIQPGRRPRGPALRDLIRSYQERAGITDETGTAGVTMSTQPQPDGTPSRDRPQRAALDPAAHAGYGEHPPRMGFFTDTSVCIGCKACEVACKEWNACPRTGWSCSACPTTTPAALGATTWRHVAFIEQIGRPGERRPAPDAGSAAGARLGGRLPLADVHRRVQALHRRGLPGRLPDRRADAHRVRHGGRPGTTSATAAATASSACPFGVIDRREADGRALQVHAVLRPARRRARAGLRQGLPDRVDPVRAAGRAARAGPAAGGANCSEAGDVRRAALRGGPGRRRRRGGRVLPAAGRARGVRAAAGPGGDHPGPAPDVAARGHGGRRPAARRPGRLACRRPGRPACRARHDASGRRNDVRAPAWRPGGSRGVHGRGQHERDQQARRRSGGGRPREAATGAPRRPRRRAADGAAGRVRLLLRPAGPQGAGVGRAGGARLPVPGRAGRRLVGARRVRAGGRRPELARAAKVGAAGAIGLSAVALVPTSAGRSGS